MHVRAFQLLASFPNQLRDCGRLRGPECLGLKSDPNLHGPGFPEFQVHVRNESASSHMNRAFRGGSIGILAIETIQLLVAEFPFNNTAVRRIRVPNDVQLPSDELGVREQG